MLARAPLMREVEAAPAQLLWLATHRPDDFPLFLDSAASGAGVAREALGRYSILFAPPEASLLLRGDGRLECQGVKLAGTDFLTAFDEWWHSVRMPDAGAGLPFSGGWALYLSYEMAAFIEAGLKIPAPQAESICALALRVRAAVIYDHAQARCLIVSEPGAETQLRALAQALASAPAGALPRLEQSGVQPTPPAGAVVDEQDELLFREAVLRAQSYIGAGDIYQANLSRGWRVRATRAAGQLYHRLRQANPAPFGALASFPGITLLCSSPERLVRVSGGRVDTRPIAGTRARSGEAGADQSEQSLLLANPKERAEHVMLIDLERNDLGRICQPGSVEVNEFMVTESYRHVHHIVSNVRGALRTGVTPGEVLRAVFPGGTITGCPKYRCMQIIGELEGEARGAYTGSLGFINLDGSMDFNILIRTATLQGTTLEFRAGAGIVADSDWQRELAETRAKARGMVHAFGVAP
jgi:anthranilate synthase component 1